MVGAPGSGKSTFARKHFPNAKYISRDEIRFSILAPDEDYFSKEDVTWRMFTNAIFSAVEQYEYEEVVIDASHLNVFSRRKLAKALSGMLMTPWEVYYIYMDTPYEVCCQRNDLRTGRANVPHEVIKEMYNKMTIPQFDEHKNIKGVWIVRE